MECTTLTQCLLDNCNQNLFSPKSKMGWRLTLQISHPWVITMPVTFMRMDCNLKALSSASCTTKHPSSKMWKLQALGKWIRGFNAQIWREASSECMFKAMMAKFSSNPEIHSFPLQTGQTTLVEASPTETVWSVGLPLENPWCFNPEKWRRKNLAGKVLEIVRQSLN